MNEPSEHGVSIVTEILTQELRAPSVGVWPLPYDWWLQGVARRITAALEEGVK